MQDPKWVGGRNTHTHLVTDTFRVGTESTRLPPGLPANPTPAPGPGSAPLPAVTRHRRWPAWRTHAHHPRNSFQFERLSHQFCNQSFLPGARWAHFCLISFYLLDENKWRPNETRCVRALPKVAGKVRNPGSRFSSPTVHALKEGLGPVRCPRSEQMEKRGHPSLEQYKYLVCVL